MKSRLQQAGLWCGGEGSEITISIAWSVLSRVGRPGRYLGRAQDGSHEYGIIDTLTGDLLSTGKGVTLESAMCEAALNASAFINAGEDRPPCLPIHRLPGSYTPTASRDMNQEAHGQESAPG